LKLWNDFQKKKNAPPYNDLLSGIIYSFGNVMEDIASKALDSAIRKTTKTVEQSAKKMERSGKRFIQKNRERLGL